MNITIQKVEEAETGVMVGFMITKTELDLAMLLTGTMFINPNIDYKDENVLKGYIIHRLKNLES